MKNFLTLATCASLMVSAAAAQNPRPSVQIDDPLASVSPDGSNGSGISLRTDGDLWVAAWTDERGASTSNDDVWMNVSTDAGHTWNGEFRAVDASTFSLDVDDPFTEVDSGTIYCSYDDYDSVAAISRAYVTWSDDNGTTWNSTMYPGDVDNPKVYVDGSNILVLAINGAGSVNELYADWSTTGPAGLSGTFTAISNVGADVDFGGYDCDMEGSTAHITWVDDFNFATMDDQWYTTLDLTTGNLGLYEQVNTTVFDVDFFTSYDCISQIVVTGGRAHFSWHADTVPGATSASNDIVFYRNRDLTSGAWGAEMNVTGLAEDTTMYHMNAEGDNVMIGFERHAATGDQEPFLWVSSDGGATFTEHDLDMVDESGTNIKDVENIACYMDGEMLFMFACDDSMTPGSSWDRQPVFWWSNDNGATMSGPVQLGGPFEIDEDADPQPRSYY
ncbi:MAG: sialidase family protein, partial [Planctomycetota bacterium]